MSYGCSPESPAEAYKDARKLSHIEEDVGGINARTLVITDHPKFTRNGRQSQIQHSDDIMGFTPTGALPARPPGHLSH